MMTNLSLFTENSLTNKNTKISGFVKFSAYLDKKSQAVAKKKNISKPYQFFGVWIAQNIGDYDHIAIYIKLSKYQDRNLLEQAVSYVKDYPSPNSRHNLFMWYLKGKLKKMPASKKKSIEKKLF